MAVTFTADLDCDVLSENNSWTPLETIEIPENRMLDWDVSFLAFRVSDGAMAHWRRIGRARRLEGEELEIVGLEQSLVDPPHKDLAALAWDVRIQAVDDGQRIEFAGKGGNYDVLWSFGGSLRSYIVGT